MSNDALRRLLTDAGERMAIDLSQELTTHRGENGRCREEALRRFLRRHLPRRFDVADGFAFDWQGRQSDQLDIVIANPFVAPQFETEGGLRLHPIESVLSVGQVRSKLTSEAEFLDALDNLASVTSLDRSANGAALCYETGRPIQHTADHRDRVFTFLVITGRSLSGDRMRELLLDYALGTECHMWPNAIIALDKFILTFHCDDGACPNTMHARGLSLLTGAPGVTLLQFYLYLAQALEVTSVGSVPYASYLSNLKPDVDAVFSTRNLPHEAPPLLSSMIWLSNSVHEQRREGTRRRRTGGPASTRRRARS